MFNEIRFDLPSRLDDIPFLPIFLIHPRARRVRDIPIHPGLKAGKRKPRSAEKQSAADDELLRSMGIDPR